MKHVNSDQEEGAKPERLLTTLLTTRASEIADMDEDALVKEIRTTYEKLWGESSHQYQCRLIDGSYTVTRVVDNDVELPNMLNRSKRGKPENPTSEGEDEEEGPQGATQHIETVATSGLMKVLGRLAKSMYSRGHATSKETKVIAEGMNLCLDPGKLYLVLGLPGSGKSTLLKMIANTLPQDDKHVVGGKLLVNGMSPSDKGVVWAVSKNCEFCEF
jgi:ABC-type glutathione transport system ATPase component